MIPPFRGVIFDMDGLVLDTEPIYRRAWRQAADALGYRLDDALWRSLSGLQYADVERLIVERCGPGFPVNRFRALSGERWRRHVETAGIDIMPGVDRLLGWLGARGIPFCLATNSQRANALECLRLAGIADRFERIVARDQVAEGKPAPDLFLEAARQLRLAPAVCLVLEDSEVGIRAARRAGAIPVLVSAAGPADACAGPLLLAVRSLFDVVELLDHGGR